ncbi:class I SAM-dependent methyltransferase, partial [candidate division KSB1 bacterium]|nr:class I SAM-dependent methyltransferase [candidate division KSB1 bacterium]NIR68843.1 class I SAM-dependent methyltransferase [candidate division KSB1 bacterium]NIS27207.1 class I SAM-dependent methyltransferase [candidate division KSB1 bacterium]NIT74092.1 class I SAM-dependent methyltransferase [candidate division KSB1 bacterium]NIU27941.1 class I SAM-dependent methyltransferase [candidate division KSB1 bacterium]
YPHRDEEEAKTQVDFVEEVVPLKAAHRILDLGCGNGRHAKELTQRGYHITCLDLSSVLLTLARQRYGDENCCIRFVQADMRHIPFNQAFNAILSFFTTFGYFKSDEENLQTLTGIHQALKPDGWFFEDYLNKSFVIKNLVPSDYRREDGFEIIQERRYNETDERIEKKITLKEDGKVREYFESVRLYTLNEMEVLLSKSDLVLEKVFGDFDGSPFSEESPRLILIGRKRAIT